MNLIEYTRTVLFHHLYIDFGHIDLLIELRRELCPLQEFGVDACRHGGHSGQL